MLKKIILILVSFSLAQISIADEFQDIRTFVNGLSSDVINIAANDKTTDSDKYKELAKIFLKTVDINWMARFAIGRHWKNFSDTQKKAYIQAYRRFILSVYIPKFKSYNEQVFKITSISNLPRNQFLVSIDIIPSNKKDPVIKMDYRVRQIKGAFKIRDIIAEKVSLITAQRSDFTSFVTKEGIDQLIKSLHDKVS